MNVNGLISTERLACDLYQVAELVVARALDTVEIKNVCAKLNLASRRKHKIYPGYRQTAYYKFRRGQNMYWAKCFEKETQVLVYWLKTVMNL